MPSKAAPPILPLFLQRDRREKSLFTLRFGVCRRGRKLDIRAKAENATIMVDGKAHNLAELIRRPDITVPVQNPDLHPSHHIQVPKSWRMYVGEVPSGGDILMFTTDFGDVGGQYIAPGSMIRVGVDYYLVVPHTQVSVVRRCFDEVHTEGLFGTRSNRPLVMRVRIGRRSHKLLEADQWLADHGYRLANINVEAMAIWPPQLRSNGIDEPLFRHAVQIYQAPLGHDDHDGYINPVVRVRAVRDRNARADLRHVGLLGFATNTVTQMQLEESCCFLLTNRLLPWNAFMATRTYPMGLQLASPSVIPPALDLLDECVEGNHTVTTTTVRTCSNAHIPTVLNRSVDRHQHTAHARNAASREYPNPTIGMIIAQTRAMK